jgi:hypothetical protein
LAGIFREQESLERGTPHRRHAWRARHLASAFHLLVDCFSRHFGPGPRM